MRSRLSVALLALSGCHFGGYFLPLQPARRASAQVGSCEPLTYQNGVVIQDRGATWITSELSFPEGVMGRRMLAFDSVAYSSPNLRFTHTDVGASEDQRFFPVVAVPLDSVVSVREVRVGAGIEGYPKRSTVGATPISLRLYWTPAGGERSCVIDLSLTVAQ